MLYLKATLTGFISAVIFATGWLVAAAALPMLWQIWQQRNQGGGAAAVGFSSGPILVAGVIGFALGFAWVVRRLSH
jgi:hypothetical protein